MTITPNPAVVSELAPNGVLRAGINLSNFLLVTGRAANGDPQGIAPDMAGEIASRLKVPLQLIAYESPGKLADAVADFSREKHDIAIAYVAATCGVPMMTDQAMEALV